MQHKALVAYLVVVGLFGLAWFFFFPTTITIGSCLATFSVHIKVSDPNEPPRAVACYVASNRKSADELRDRQIAPETRLFDDTGFIAEPFVGDQPLQVLVRYSDSTDTSSGRYLGNTQPRFLVVVAVWPDGQKRATIVGIPDVLEKSREIDVTLP